MQSAPLSSSQKDEVLRRQAFKCYQCQSDLEPVGRAPPHFVRTGPVAAKGASLTANIKALCPTCHAVETGPEGGKVTDAKRGRRRESDSNRNVKKFVKTGFDNKKF